MQRNGGSDGSLGEAVRDVSRHAVALAKLEAKLAKSEVSDKVRVFLPAVVLGLVGVVLALFGLGYGLAAAAEGLDAVLPRWAALLVVAGTLLAVAALLGVIAAGVVKRASPPVPEQAIEEAKRTTQALRSPETV
jgi:hypothetical protein